MVYVGSLGPCRFEVHADWVIVGATGVTVAADEAVRGVRADRAVAAGVAASAVPVRAARLVAPASSRVAVLAATAAQRRSRVVHAGIASPVRRAAAATRIANGVGLATGSPGRLGDRLSPCAGRQHATASVRPTRINAFPCPAATAGQHNCDRDRPAAGAPFGATCRAIFSALGFGRSGSVTGQRGTVLVEPPYG